MPPLSRTTPIYVAVVDDDESLCRSLSRLLRASDIRAVTYSSAEAFLADTKHPRFDCLVLDIQLGGMSGLELVQQLADVADHTPIIFITAHDDEEAWEQAMVARCAAYFRKTDCGADVLDAIRRLAA
jgi:FixJ family two-component response regulator